MCHHETSYDKWCWDESIEQGKNDLERQSWFDQKLIWVLQSRGFIASKYAWLNIGEGEGTLQWQQKCEE